MSLEQRINEDTKSALKEGRKNDLITYRSILAQIKDERIKLRVKREMTEDDVVHVLLNAVKKRKEAIELYRQGKRADLVAKEENELRLIQKYLPEQLSEEEISNQIAQIIQKVGATSIKDLGKVMGLAMAELKGKAEGQVVQTIAREKLAQL